MGRRDCGYARKSFPDNTSPGHERGIRGHSFDRIFAALPIEKYDSFLYIDLRGEVDFSTVEKEGLQVSCGIVKLAASFV